MSLVGCGGAAELLDDAVVEVAAASNLAPVLDSLFAAFTALHEVPTRASLAGTGQLYAQIVHGAPFHVMLAADDERPRLLEEAGQAVAGSRFTFALGRLALYAPTLAPLPSTPWSILDRADIRVAVANPRTAPYGMAGMELLASLEVSLGGAPRWTVVTGENVGQALQFVRSGAAEVGFVALSQVRHEPEDHYVVVPDSLHAALPHDAVLLGPGRDHEGARAFLDFLRTEEASRILRAAGYEPPSPERPRVSPPPDQAPGRRGPT